jgi:hypothetical protein
MTVIYEISHRKEKDMQNWKVMVATKLSDGRVCLPLAGLGSILRKSENDEFY